MALESINNQQTLAELSKRLDVSLVVISKWKSELLEKLPGIFVRPGSSPEAGESVDTEKLYAQIGQLKVENDFLNKVSANWEK